VSTLEDALFSLVDASLAVDLTDGVEELGLGELQLVHEYMLSIYYPTMVEYR
jgi:hypothetical protein